jgi:hypothetical protein
MTADGPLRTLSLLEELRANTSTAWTQRARNNREMTALALLWSKGLGKSRMRVGRDRL